MRKTVINIVVYVVVFLLIQFACMTTFGMIATFIKGGEDTGSTSLNATGLIVAMLVSCVIALVVFLLARWAVVSPIYLRSRPWTVFFWCVIASTGAIIPSVWLQELMPELPNYAEDTFDMILRDRWGYVVIGLFVPLVEEVVFRGAVLRELLKAPLRPWIAIALSALIFSVAHGNPVQMPHAFLVGLLLGWMYWRTRSILPGVIYHWVNNTAAYVFYNLYPDPNLRLADLFGGNQRTVYMAVGLSLLILLPALYQLWLHLRPAEERK